MHTRHLYLGLAILLPVAFSAPCWADEAGATPSAFVAGLAQKAFATVNDKALSAADRGRGLDKLLDTGFDMPQIALYVVGPYWQGASTDERQAFTGAFRDYIGRAYSERFADYEAGTFRVVGQREETATSTVVSTEIAKTAEAEKADPTSPDQPVRLDWVVMGKDGYRVVDVIVGGISMATTRRAEFTSYLRNTRGGLADLTQRLQATTTARQ